MMFLCLLPVVIDGDTFKCEGGRRVRMWGINAPEVGQPGSREATLTLKREIGLWLRCKPKGRSYNRVVAQCFTPASVDLSGRLLDRGVVVQWCNYSHHYYRQPCR